MADDTNNQQAQLFTPEQTDAIKQLIGGIVNTSFRSHITQADKKRDQDKQDFAKMLDERLAAFKPTTTSDDDPKGSGKGKRSKEDDVEMATLRKQVEELRQQGEVSQQKAARERAKNVENSLRASVFEALSEHGLDASRAKHVLATFKFDNRLEAQIDDETDDLQILFRDDDGSQVPLKDGIGRWVKTDAAKLFLPPSGAKGSGSRPANGGVTKGPLQDADIRRNLGEALKSALT